MSQSNLSLWKSGDEDSPENTEQKEVEGSLRLSRKPQTSTRVSLLVEALIRGIIAAYESDSRKAVRAYRRICSHLFRMGLIDESWNMKELESARGQFENALLQLLEGAPTRSPSLSSSLWPGENSTSQYKREFEEIKYIGGGAFGKVFRVKHKLDGAEYAVKKIPIYTEGLSSIKTYLSEVKTFACLNHPNIVQYKAAWLEICSPLEAASLPQSQWKNRRIPSPDHQSLLFNKNIPNSFTNSHSETNSKTSFEIAFEDSKKTTSKSLSSSSNKGVDSPESSKAIILQKKLKSVPQVCWATLYIQMSLCHGTLHQWIRRRTETINLENAVTSNAAHAIKTKAIKEILIQILKGLAYVHSKGVVHHDIKPSNIFVSADGGSLVVQLGDFGLACPLQQTRRHCLDRGTPLYAAPEQLAGRCNPKSDMYSVGIVLFELLEDFGTDMERTRRITELRSRTDPPAPKDLKLDNLVTALVRRLPEERPDAVTLLQALEDNKTPSTSELEALQERLSEKDREIQRLTELLRKNGIEL